MPRNTRSLMKVEEGEFTEDIEELSFDKIPLLDKDTAEILGDRKMGSMVDMVSQFEADDIYSQINYQGNPVPGISIKVRKPDQMVYQPFQWNPRLYQD